MEAEHGAVGISVDRVDARAKVTGRALFPCDLAMPGMLHMKILFAERPHARILQLDTIDAQGYPGVVAVFTAKDVPVNKYGLQTPDQPVLCGPGSDPEGADVVRFVGDQIALVVAETEAAASAARDPIKVKFEDLPLAPAILAAIRDATGTWMDGIPVTPERMWRALQRRGSD